MKPKGSSGNRFKLKTKIWLVDEEGRMIIGEGRRRIFSLIHKTGSMNQVASLLKMSYRAVWGKVKATQDSLGFKIVETNKKRGSCLTKEGLDLLKRYEDFKKELSDIETKLFEKYFGDYSNHR